METKLFTVFWRDGSRKILKGVSVEDAFNRAGYGNGSLRAVDFYKEGVDLSYRFKDKAWIEKEAYHIHILDAKADHILVRNFVRELMDVASEIVFDIEGGDRLVIEKKPHLFEHGWTTLIALSYGACTKDPVSEEIHYVGGTVEYEDPEQLDRAINRLLARLGTPNKASGFPLLSMLDLEMCSIQQRFHKNLHG
jgi:hypothetical protein